MTAQFIDGKAIARKVQAEVAAGVVAFKAAHGRAPSLHVLLTGDDPSSQVHVRNKERACLDAGMLGAVHRVPADTSEAALLALVDELNRDPAVDGILVQLPLPAQVRADTVIATIDPRKDVDGLTPINAGLLFLGRPQLVPCTPAGCLRLLDETGIELAGKRALVIGRSSLIGKPLAQLLLARHATVTLAHSQTQGLAHLVADSDVVASAAGQAALVRGEWIKPGATVLDIGMNRNAEGRLCGDVELEVARGRAAWIAPMPGGVGPMTIAMLLVNTLKAAQHRANPIGARAQ